MFLAEHLSAFYPDLLDERFTSRFAIFHQRYSTNTFPQWKLAQPFRVLAHNGEINTLLGNVNWMKSHEARLEHDGFGRFIEDLKPIIQPGASDSSALDNVFELLVRGHRNLPMVKAMMIPEASALEPQRAGQAPRHVQLRERRDGAVGRPGRDRRRRRQVGAGRPRPQRPAADALRRDLRRAADRRLRSPAWCRRTRAKIVEKGRLGPGEMLAVDMDQPQLYKDRELKDMLADTHDYAAWTTRTVELEFADQAGHAARPSTSRPTSCAAGSSRSAGRSRISR